MDYYIHHPEANAPVDLRGGASNDIVSLRFDAALIDMIALANQIRVNRSKRFGLETGDLYITEAGRRIVHILKGAL